MKAKLLINSALDKKAKSKEEFWLFASELIFAWAKDNLHILSHDFTPPPFRKKLEQFLQQNKIKYLQHADGVSLEFETPEQIVKSLCFINWTNSLVVRVVDTELLQSPIPEMKRRLMLNAPHDWYVEHQGDFFALCFLGINPNPAFEIRTSRVSYDEILRTHSTALKNKKFAIREIETCIVVQ